MDDYDPDTDDRSFLGFFTCELRSYNNLLVSIAIKSYLCSNKIGYHKNNIYFFHCDCLEATVTNQIINISTKSLEVRKSARSFPRPVMDITTINSSDKQF